MDMGQTTIIDIATEITKQNWVKPNVTIISVNNQTLGPSVGKSDGIGGSSS